MSNEIHGAASAAAAAADSATMKLLVCVNQSSIKGYPHPSISSANAFQWILDKFAQQQDLQLSILHVQVPDTDDDFDDLDSVYTSPEDFAHVKKKEQVRGLHLLKHFVHKCDEAKVPCSAWIQEGDPKDVICREAARAKPDVLVLGSRGLGTLKRMFVASVSVHCTTHACCPVLVIKRKAEEVPEDPCDD